jgi:hypothetical protein
MGVERSTAESRLPARPPGRNIPLDDQLPSAASQAAALAALASELLALPYPFFFSFSFLFPVYLVLGGPRFPSSMPWFSLIPYDILGGPNVARDVLSRKSQWCLKMSLKKKKIYTL